MNQPTPSNISPSPAGEGLVMQPISGHITSKFGSRVHPVTRKVSFHNGIDIACKIGTPIVAPADGIVTQVWEDKNGGLSLAMVSNDGIRFGFAHLSSQISAINDRVHEGQTIALSGKSGRCTGPHLHLTVKIGGKHVDPMEYFNYD